MPLYSPKLVIFDCDGVVVDSVMAHCEVLSASFAKYGLKLTPQQCHDELGSGKMASIGEAAKKKGADLPENWIDEIYHQIFTRLRKGVPLISGIQEVLDHLDASNTPYCLASNGSKEKMSIMLGKSGIFDRFENAIFSAHAINSWKPDPQLFLHAAKRMKVLTQDCLVIEDSVTGVIAAKRAQMLCLGYAPKTDGQNLKAEGAFIFHNLHELIYILK